MNKKKIFIITALAICLLATVINGAVGSEDDPLISLSYIENVLMPYIDEVAGGEDPGFTVVELSTGQSLVAHGGSEIILRSGDGVAVIPKSAAGGFTDVTAGRDVINGERVLENHLLICPRSDGRKMRTLHRQIQKCTLCCVYLLIFFPT